MTYKICENLLEESIIELRKIEPFWERCFPCQHKGKCCKDADIEITESEWLIISDYIQALDVKDKKILKRNILLRSYCVFRSKDKCLIHEVRPENCRYTPFQCVITDDNRLLYSKVSDNCNFEDGIIELNAASIKHLKNAKYIQLDNFEKQTYYLSLNHLAQHDVASEKIFKVSNLLNEILFLLKQH